MTTEDEKNEETTEETPAETAEETEESTDTAEAADADASGEDSDAEDTEAEAPEAQADDADDADEADEADETATEAAPQGDDYDPSIVGAAAHLFGISRPQDEYGTRAIDRDGMSDEELLKMGVEPDAGPGAKISLTFVAMTVVLMLTGVATAALFGWVNDAKGDAISDRVHPQLVDARESSAAVLNSYAELEGDSYRVPIATGMDILVNSPGLLGGLEDGPSTDPAEPSPEGFYVVPTPTRAAVPAPSPVNPANRIGQPQIQPGQNVGIAVPAGAVPVPVNPAAGHAGGDAHDNAAGAADPHAGTDH